MAIQGQVPILPVVYSSYQSFFNDERRILNSGEIIIEALQEIPTKGLTFNDVDRLMEQTRQLMIEKFAENNKEMRLKAEAKMFNSNY